MSLFRVPLFPFKKFFLNLSLFAQEILIICFHLTHKNLHCVTLIYNYISHIAILEQVILSGNNVTNSFPRCWTHLLLSKHQTSGVRTLPKNNQVYICVSLFYLSLFNALFYNVAFIDVITEGAKVYIGCNWILGEFFLVPKLHCSLAVDLEKYSKYTIIRMYKK